VSDPGVSVAAEVRYEIRIQRGPCRFQINGVEFYVAPDQDMCVLCRLVFLQRSLMSETIAGVVGGGLQSDCAEMLRLCAFLQAGGVIGLHRDLDGR